MKGTKSHPYSTSKHLKIDAYGLNMPSAVEFQKRKSGTKDLPFLPGRFHSFLFASMSSMQYARVHLNSKRTQKDAGGGVRAVAPADGREDVLVHETRAALRAQLHHAFQHGLPHTGPAPPEEPPSDQPEADPAGSPLHALVASAWAFGPNGSGPNVLLGATEPDLWGKVGSDDWGGGRGLVGDA